MNQGHTLDQKKETKFYIQVYSTQRNCLKIECAHNQKVNTHPLLSSQLTK